MELVTTHICMTKDIGVHGNLFGGIMLSWMDEAASVCVANICRTRNIVTLKLDEVVFRKKVNVGHLIKVYAEVCKLGRTSIALALEARRSIVEIGEEEIVASTIITFVQIDDDGKPFPLADHVRERYAHLKKAQ
jgi:acyl-CoA thioesterase YciA